MDFIYRIFLKGLLTLLPITLTVYLLVWVVTQAESLLAQPMRKVLPSLFEFPGSGVLLSLSIVFAVGLLVNSYITRRFVIWFEERLNNLPVIRSIYSPIRDVTNLFAKTGGQTSQKVVMVQFDNGIEFLGLVTRDHFHDLPSGTVAESSLAVFVPYSYGMGGLTIVVPKSKVRETTLTADRAMQLAITGWVKSSKG